MEYLSRTLNLASEELEFKFHPRCSKIKLNHLAFADDLMLSCKGDLQSISILIKTVDYFSSCSGLKANNSKSGIYLTGVSNEFRAQADQTIDYSFESLPVKYLRMPITSKRYSATDYEYLVDKMTARIRVWYVKNLSYTARLQLVNSVLMSITNYWCQAVILPIKVIRQVNAICRSFLWFGSIESKNLGNISWEKVCKPKKEEGGGGLESEIWSPGISLLWVK